MRRGHLYKVIALSILYLFVLLLPATRLEAQNFTNKGKEFWVGYGHNHLFTLSNAFNAQEMVLYLSAEQPAHVTVSVTGTSWTRQYTIPANTVIPSDLLPKSGPDDCRLMTEGLSNHGIHIESDVPIVAYAHVYGQNSSGAAMLLPVESYGYTYFSLNSEQNYDPSCYSWFFVAAAENNTRVRITPSNATAGGKASKTPFEVVLNKGQLYNVMGATQGSGTGNDMSGSKIQSIPGSDGICHPIAVFSGSSRTYVCNPGFGGGGDFMIQQVFPVSAWGTRYLTALTSSTVAPSQLNNNKFRVYVKEPGTLVRRNGVLLSGLTNNSFYEYLSVTADYITASKPVMVAQFIPSSTGCGTTGDGDPEMFYLSPIEQAINHVSFYNTNKENITTNYLTLILPQAGLSSLLIDGSPAVDYSYPHPNMAGYQVVVKQMATTPMQHNVQSDSGFTAITYGLGPVESYGYNAGSYVNNLTTISEVKNTNGTGTSNHTCPGTPFYLSLETIYQPTSIVWHFSRVNNISPATDVTINSPVPSGTVIINGKTYYRYELPQACMVNALGSYSVPVSIYDPQIDNCSQSEEITIDVPVQPGPAAAFTTANVCAADSAHFTDASPGPGISQWLWDFGDGHTDTHTNTVHLYSKAGSYSVHLQLLRNSDGCFGHDTQTIVAHPMPVAAFVLPPAVCMPGGQLAVDNQSTLAGSGTLAYAWQFGDGGVSTDQQPVHQYAVAGPYTVQLIATSPEGCADTVAHPVGAFAQRPVAHFVASDTAFCEDKKILLSDSSYTVPAGNAIAAYHWLLGDGSDAVTTNPVKSYNAAGSYTIQLLIKSQEGCWSDTASLAVTVYPVPVVDAGPDMTTEPDHAVTLQGSVDEPSAIIRWTPGTGLSATDQLQPKAMPPATQKYYLTATIQHGCSATDSVLLHVYKELKVPNAFTPNGDGHNDRWIIPGLADYPQATVEVFNRWGQMVYHSVGYGIPWDGSFKGGLLPTGAYYYVINPNGGGFGRQTGSVLLIR